MAAPAVLERTREAVSRLRADGRSLEVWVRDDDLCKPSASFWQFLESSRIGVPILVAVVPNRLEFSDDDIRRLEGYPDCVRFCVHGYNHVSHGHFDRGPSEYGDDRDQTIVETELAHGLTTVTGTFKSRSLPIFVPPWNHMGQSCQIIASRVGYIAVSGAVGRELDKSECELQYYPVDIDLLEYSESGVHRLKSLDDIDHHLVDAVRTYERDSKVVRLGMLTHHNAMPLTDLRVLDELLRNLSDFVHFSFPWADDK